MRRVAAVVALVGGLGLVACGGGSSAPKAGSYVGKVAGTDAYIALVTKGGKVAGYVCDGAKVSVWLPAASVSGHAATLANRRGARAGTARWSGSAASGTVSIDGVAHAFSATLATGDAGLYRAVHGTPGQAGAVEVGWVVLADGTQRGMITSFITPITQLAAPKLNTSSSSVNITAGSFSSLMVVNKFITPITNL